MKYRMIILQLCGLFLFFLYAHAQVQDAPAIRFDGPVLTGNLQYDLSMGVNQDRGIDSVAPKRTGVLKRKYSPMKAALYSAVIPGAGQFYTKSYWKSATYLGAEVLLWIGYAIYQQKGNKQTDAFQNYADEHWSVVRYAHWIQANYPSYYNAAIVHGEPGTPVPDGIAQAWNYVDWSALNAAEDAVGASFATTSIETGFTHKLELHGEQQYYELIGKYPQFGGGWDDAATFKAGGFTIADVVANRGYGNVSPRFLAYSQMRGDANKFYNIATTVSYIIIANHVFSALEAALNASKINHRIQLQGHIESRQIYGNMVEFVPTLHMQYEL
jgi:hypothetical protein